VSKILKNSASNFSKNVVPLSALVFSLFPKGCPWHSSRAITSIGFKQQSQMLLASKKQNAYFYSNQNYPYENLL
jgi:hypothetical protein